MTFDPSKRELVPFQQRGEDTLVERKRSGVFMYMGSGKTPVTARAVVRLCIQNNYRRIVVVCPDNAIEVWKTDGLKWMTDYMYDKFLPEYQPIILHIMDDEPWNRELIWNRPTPPYEIHIYIVVYNTFAQDMGVPAKVKTGKKSVDSRQLKRIINAKQGFDVYICDEARRIRNRTSAAFRALSQFETIYKPKCFFPLTGTPTSKGPQHFWTMLNLINRHKFRSYWEFVKAFHHTDTNPWGGLEIGEPINQEIWLKVLAKYAYVIPKDDPELCAQMAGKLRQLWPIEMDDEQKDLYRDFQKDMMSIVGDDVIFAQNSMTQFLRLRQILICPQLLHPDKGVGNAIKDTVSRIKNEELELPLPIFTPFTATFEPFKEYLRSQGYPHIFTLQGGMGHAAQATAIAGWRQTNGIILCSTQYAEAFSLEPARQAVAIGYHPDPNVNDQAESRLQRMTTQYPTMTYYYTFRQTVDYRMAEITTIKQDHIDWSLPKNFRQLIKDNA